MQLSKYCLIIILTVCSCLFVSANSFGQDNSNNQSNTVDIPTDAATVANGRKLFSQHCTACHQIDQQVIGPALASVHQRRPLPWLLKFIKNSQDVINSGEDEYATQLFKQYNGVVMTNFDFLSDDDIISILAYIKSESTSQTSSGGVNGSSSSANPAGAASGNDNDATDGAYSQKDGNQASSEVSSGLPFGTLFAVLTGVLILIGVIFVVARKSGSK